MDLAFGDVEERHEFGEFIVERDFELFCNSSEVTWFEGHLVPVNRIAGVEKEFKDDGFGNKLRPVIVKDHRKRPEKIHFVRNVFLIGTSYIEKIQF